MAANLWPPNLGDKLRQRCLFVLFLWWVEFEAVDNMRCIRDDPLIGRSGSAAPPRLETDCFQTRERGLKPCNELMIFEAT